MLKKLVKYGNSNAIILDKAILELLEIEEGSIIKIKTDGKSIIISPQEKATSMPVHETFTHDQATIEATVKESFKFHKGIDSDKQEQLEKELQNLIKKHQTLSLQIPQNPDFVQELAIITKQFEPSSGEYFEAFKALKNKIFPELGKIEHEIENFGTKNNLHAPVSNAQQTAMFQEFVAAHKKNQDIYKAHGEILNNPEYQHEAQLIAEKYGADKNSADYLQAMEELNAKYHPEYRNAQKELKAVAKRFTNKATK